MDAAAPPAIGPWVRVVASAARRAMVRRVTEEGWVDCYGIRAPYVEALHSLAEHEPLSQRELSETLGVDPSDMVEVVGSLERAGLVVRRTDPDDRRRHLLRVSDSGAELVERLGELIVEVEDEVLAPLSEAERRTMGNLLRRVAEHHGASAHHR